MTRSVLLRNNDSLTPGASPSRLQGDSFLLYMERVREDLSAALGDRYTIDRVLGRGGMATVYVAEDLRHSRQVAIKDRKSTRLNSSHSQISYAVFCLKKKSMQIISQLNISC